MSVVPPTVWLLLPLLMASPRVPRARARTLNEPLPVRCAADSDCFLPCQASRKPGVAYPHLTWYRQQDSAPQLGTRAILSWDLINSTRREPLGRDEELLPEDGHAVHLHNVSCTHAGLYSCFLAAPLGEQNQESWLRLSVTGCAGSPTPGSLLTDVTLAVATVVLVLSLVVFRMSYVCLRNSLRDRHRPMRKEVVVTLDTPLRPLDEKDLMMIRTLGPKPPAAPPTSTSRWSWTKLVEPLSDAR
ncbi:uncharacterized protein LOC142882358 [Nelusetta ayraudi]|uniref:uncharacterized protein LOC142882358 n=1 Tax=Nelusetta ayraudi TaxID=303726 RepID=UPI003F6F4D71